MANTPSPFNGDLPDWTNPIVGVRVYRVGHLYTREDSQTVETSRLWLLPLYVSLCAALAFPAAALGTRFGLWGYKTGFLLLAMAWGAGFLGFAGCLAAFFHLSGPVKGLNVAAGALALAMAAGPIVVAANARGLPSINDISTDTDNPPRFEALLPLRAGAETSAEYQGPKAAALQNASYPAVAPKILASTPSEAYQRALDRARALGWNVVGENPAQGRFEAWDRTSWFGFTDDVVVRITPDKSGARVDVRSHSRVGKADLGTNAKRIIAFLSGL